MRKIILILLILIVLASVSLIVILRPGKISPGPSNNIEAVKNSCSVACQTNQISDYCYFIREIRDGVNDKFSDTCYNLSMNNQYKERNYMIGPCFKIDCISGEISILANN